MRYKPNKNELFAKGSSLALAINKDKMYDFTFYVWDRRTNRILYKGDVPLVTLKSYMNLDKVVKKNG